MTEDELAEMWSNDMAIDPTNLEGDLLALSQMRTKYWRIYNAQRIRLEKVKADYNRLRMIVYEMYTGKASEEDYKRRKAGGYPPPPSMKILKSEAPMYMDADPEMIDISIKFADAKRHVDNLKLMLESIDKKSMNIAAYQKERAYKNGN